jgi:hypothetical protein
MGPTNAPSSAPSTSNAPSSAPSIPIVAVAVGGAFGTGSASAGVSSTGGTGKSFGNGNSKGFSSSFARKPSGAEVMTDSIGRGNAQTDASVNVLDKIFASGYSNVQNSGYGASFSANGAYSNYNLDAVVKTLTAETTKEMPFFGLFSGGFGSIFATFAAPVVSTSDTSISREEASDAGTSDTEIIQEDSIAAGGSPYKPYQSKTYGSFGSYGSYGYSP